LERNVYDLGKLAKIFGNVKHLENIAKKMSLKKCPLTRLRRLEEKECEPLSIESFGHG